MRPLMMAALIGMMVTVSLAQAPAEAADGVHEYRATSSGDVERPEPTVLVDAGLRSRALAAADAGEPLELLTPEGERLPFALRETRVFAPDPPDVSGTARDTGEPPAHTFVRTFEEGESTHPLRLTTGHTFAYGSAATPEWSIVFTVDGVGDAAQQEVQWTPREPSVLDLEPALPSVRLEPDLVATYTSKMVMDVDYTVRNTWSDWQAWATAAFNHHQGAWDGQVDVDLQLWGPYGVSNSVTSNGDCAETGGTSTAKQYSNWLNGNEITGAHSYFLFHRHNMYDPSSCHGVARSNTINQGYHAASVAEGTDVSGTDAYNPSDAQERGVLQMHEAGHVHGSAHHGTCPWWKVSCYVMPASIWNYDVVNTDFPPASEDEIEDLVATRL